MKVLKTEIKETVHTLELTDVELNTLIMGLGKTNHHSRDELANQYGIKTLGFRDSQIFYHDLKNKFLRK
ncbi:hypothetical protein [Priestia megaterium]|uniref:hypothetical protein n=1 Tax=Priestia megaterium TaxID=1404 RepID=UPI000BF5982E|nr:hypothetical protein [Priestia megaterium]PFW43827.1 hypothetical protein COL17_26845 [Priestia megaterium]